MLFSGSGSCSWPSSLVSPLSWGLNSSGRKIAGCCCSGLSQCVCPLCASGAPTTWGRSSTSLTSSLPTGWVFHLTQCNGPMKMVLQGSRGEERKRTEEMLGRWHFFTFCQASFIPLYDHCQIENNNETKSFSVAKVIKEHFTGWPSLTGSLWSTWASAWTRTTSPTWSTWWRTTSMMSMSMRRRWCGGRVES